MKKWFKVLIPVLMITGAVIFTGCPTNTGDEVDATELESRIAYAENLWDNTHESDSSGSDIPRAQYWVPVGDKDILDAAIDAARIALESQTGIGTALDVLNAAILIFETHRTPGTKSSGYTYAEAQELVNQANALLNSVETSEDGSDIFTNQYWVTDEVYEGFYGMIQTLEFIGDSIGDQSARDTAYNDLADAIEAFGTAKQLGTMVIKSSVTITGIPNDLRNEGIGLYLADVNTYSYNMAIHAEGFGIITGSSIQIALFENYEDRIPFEDATGKSYYIWLAFDDGTIFVSDAKYSFTGNPKPTIALTLFTEIEIDLDDIYNSSVTITGLDDFDDETEIVVFIINNEFTSDDFEPFIEAIGFGEITDGESNKMGLFTYTDEDMDLWEPDGSYYVLLMIKNDFYISKDQINFSEDPKPTIAFDEFDPLNDDDDDEFISKVTITDLDLDVFDGETISIGIINTKEFTMNDIELLMNAYGGGLIIDGDASIGLYDLEDNIWEPEEGEYYILIVVESKSIPDQCYFYISKTQYNFFEIPKFTIDFEDFGLYAFKTILGDIEQLEGAFTSTVTLDDIVALLDYADYAALVEAGYPLFKDEAMTDEDEYEGTDEVTEETAVYSLHALPF